MIDPDKYKDGIKRELEALQTLREELRVQANLAKADARTEWARLESRFERAQEEWKRTQDHAKAAVQELATDLRAVFEELKRGYGALRRTLQE